MARSNTAYVRVTNRLTPTLWRIRSGLKQAIARAAEREANAIMTESKLIVPVDTGALRGTGTVEPATWFGDTVMVLLRYGGEGVDYAVPVHEILPPRINHRLPTMAKFLELPMNGARWEWMDRVGADVQAWVDTQAAK